LGELPLRIEREPADPDPPRLDHGDAAFRERVSQDWEVVEQQLDLLLGPALSSAPEEDHGWRRSSAGRQ
jgi:hypothetical protein